MSRLRDACGRVFAIALGSGACAGTVPSPPRVAEASAGCSVTADSARLVQVALDTLARLDPFDSAVHRLEPGDAGTRVITRPTDEATLDGMAAVLVDLNCQILSVVQSDSL